MGEERISREIGDIALSQQVKTFYALWGPGTYRSSGKF